MPWWGAFDSFGPFERASGLRRVDQLLMDLAMNPDFVERLVGKITDVLCRLAEIYVETAGEYLDILELPGDDYAPSA
jgi:uroporphyrinogen decarboxylase